MDEVFKYQESITDAIHQENLKYKNLEEAHQLDEMILKMKEYNDKLVNVKKNMLLIKDRTIKLKRRATRMLEDKNKRDIEQQKSRERREMLEKHLEPVVNTKDDSH